MRDVQDVEFTIQDGRLYILQCRDAKRSGAAAMRIASDLLAEGLATPETVVGRLVTPAHIDQLLHPHFADVKVGSGARQPVAKGMPASPGAAVGRVVFSAADAVAWCARGDAVILVRVETSAEDVAGMHSAQVRAQPFKLCVSKNSRKHAGSFAGHPYDARWYDFSRRSCRTRLG